jgi:maltose O-acetyltransferase
MEKYYVRANRFGFLMPFVSAHTAQLLPRLLRAAREEVNPLISRRVLVDVATALPGAAFSGTRTALLKAAGVRIGPRSRIQGAVRITGIGNPCSLLSIGTDTLVSGGLHVDLGAPVRIGSGVRIGHDVSLLTISHEVGVPLFRAGASQFDGIVIEDGCWLASRCTILPGVTIGLGAIVAAGAIVTRDVSPNTLVAGVPARLVRELEPNERDTVAAEGVEPSSYLRKIQ